MPGFQGISLSILSAAECNTEESNETSLVARIEAGGCSLILPRDIEGEPIRQLQPAQTSPESTTLRLPHHGSCIKEIEREKAVKTDECNDAIAFVKRVNAHVLCPSSGGRMYKHPQGNFAAILPR